MSMLLQPYALGSDMVIFSNRKTLDITLNWDTWTITLGGRFMKDDLRKIRECYRSSMDDAFVDILRRLVVHL